MKIAIFTFLFCSALTSSASCRDIINGQGHAVFCKIETFAIDGSDRMIRQAFAGIDAPTEDALRTICTNQNGCRFLYCVETKSCEEINARFLKIVPKMCE